SLPNVANQPCPWQDNWHTRGSSVPARAYVERMVAATPTEEERAEHTARAVAYVRANLCPDLTEADVRAAQEWRAAIAAGQAGERR
ncbi:hypothetical protein, partial [Streptomyces mirabilis]|uniref:hypothetical protein n=1 Tax=Streptomyces mirabilis TaxID=68239 RepID=UPI00332E7CB6